MENAPAIKANEANLEELNKKIVEIKRKIVLKGESLIISCPFGAGMTKQKTEANSKFNDLIHDAKCFLSLNFICTEGQKKANIEDWVSARL